MCRASRKSPNCWRLAPSTGFGPRMLLASSKCQHRVTKWHTMRPPASSATAGAMGAMQEQLSAKGGTAWCGWSFGPASAVRLGTWKTLEAEPGQLLCGSCFGKVPSDSTIVFLQPVARPGRTRPRWGGGSSLVVWWQVGQQAKPCATRQPRHTETGHLANWLERKERKQQHFYSFARGRPPLVRRWWLVVQYGRTATTPEDRKPRPSGAGACGRCRPTELGGARPEPWHG